MNVNQWIRVSDKFGFAIAGILLLFIIYMLAKFANDYLRQKYLKGSKKINLFKHPLFVKMQHYRRIIYDLPIENQVKKKMIISFLDIKLKVAQENLMEFIKNSRLSFLTEDELLHSIMNEVYNIISDYEKKAINEGVSKVLIIKFRSWHETRIQSTERGIEEIAKSEAYACNSMKLYVVFTLVENLFYQTIIDAYHTINDLNGDIDNEIYEGQKIGDFNLSQKKHD